MSLATLFSPVRSQGDIEQFIIANEAEHNGVSDKIFAAMGKRIDTFLLRPFFPSDFQGWLIRHSTMHTETNDVLGLASNDLMVLDLGGTESASWFWLHAQEHRQWRITLGI